jgi:hypothetical protein
MVEEVLLVAMVLAVLTRMVVEVADEGAAAAIHNNEAMCQICGKGSHDALQCWHRFDQAYQAESTTKQAAIVTHGYTIDPN